MRPLEDVLVGMSEFEIRLIRNRHVKNYRETAIPLYQEKVEALGLYDIPGLAEHYDEWLTVYQRLWP